MRSTVRQTAYKALQHPKHVVHANKGCVTNAERDTGENSERDLKSVHIYDHVSQVIVQVCAIAGLHACGTTWHGNPTACASFLPEIQPGLAPDDP